MFLEAIMLSLRKFLDDWAERGLVVCDSMLAHLKV